MSHTARGVRFGATAEHRRCASVEFPRLLGLTSSSTPPVAREPILAAFGGGPCAASCPCLERSRSSHFCIVTLANGRVGDALQGRSHGLLLPYRRAPSTVQPSNSRVPAACSEYGASV